MTNDHYLIVSYFVAFALCLGLAALTYRVLREPFERIADAALKNSRSVFLKRALPVALTTAATVGFLGVNYTYDGCNTHKYEDIVKDRTYMHEKSRAQLAQASITIVQVVGIFSVAALICVIRMKREEPKEK
ncbi:MAG: hypothetical protein ACM3JB_10425 [Acidobacteriaceae bacterium]